MIQSWNTRFNSYWFVVFYSSNVIIESAGICSLVLFSRSHYPIPICWSTGKYLQWIYLTNYSEVKITAEGKCSAGGRIGGYIQLTNDSCNQMTVTPETILSINSLHDDVIKWKHFPRYWPFVRGIHRSPMNSSRKSQWRGALMFSLICALINGWANNRETGDLRRHCTHYDVSVMEQKHANPDCLYC